MAAPPWIKDRAVPDVVPMMGEGRGLPVTIVIASHIRYLAADHPPHHHPHHHPYHHTIASTRQQPPAAASSAWKRHPASWAPQTVRHATPPANGGKCWASVFGCQVTWTGSGKPRERVVRSALRIS
ncbi:MAG: hypothetical protein KIT83_19560 [Bryobacterales bacterium]|nr:hypothetical protein [Bryobacterales bacterium]